MQREAPGARVGLTIVASLLVFATVILMVGQQARLFTPTNKYLIQFDNVAGLVPDSPVQLSGVNVGRVRDIVLPEDPALHQLQVFVEIESRYAFRIRRDSVARIKTFGLLGDKYIEITTGSPPSAQVEPGDEIPAAQPTDMDALIETGGDMAEYLLATARSISVILERMERGEGILGELVSEQQDGRITDSLASTLARVDGLVAEIEQGRGLVGMLVHDDVMADSVVSSVARLERLLANVESGDGLVPTLLNDATLVERLHGAVASFEESAGNLRRLTDSFDSAQGLVPKLLTDEEFAAKITTELESLLERLNGIVTALDEGDGTVARLLHDPSIYQALNDIVIGANESKMLRWLIRNRQQAGIEKRYDEARASESTAEAEIRP